MNKKFFTLIASVFMLAASLGTVSGQVPQITVGKAPGTVTSGKKYQLVAVTKEKFDAIRGVDWKADWFDKAADLVNRGLANDHLTALKTTSELYYVWVDKNGYLKFEATNGDLTLMDRYYESIFCVTRSHNAVAGQAATLNIQSFSNNSVLMADPATSLAKGGTPDGTFFNVKIGSIGDWAYSSIYNAASGATPARVEHFMPLYVYNPEKLNQEVLVFTLKNGKIVTEKYLASEVARGNIENNVLLFEFVEPAPRVLDAADFNTIMGQQADKAHKITFSPDRKGTGMENPWTDFDLLAIDVKANKRTSGTFPGNVTAYAEDKSLVDLPETAGDDPWLYFQRKDDKKKFLFVDTAYYEGFDNNYLRYNWSDTISAYWAKTFRGGYLTTGRDNGAGSIEPRIAKFQKTAGWDDVVNKNTLKVDSVNREFLNHYRFQATYFWTNDSLAIDVATANLKSYLYPVKFWREYPSTLWSEPHYYYGNTYYDNKDVNAEYVKDMQLSTTIDNAEFGDSLHVKMHNVGNLGLVTIGDRPLNTKITLGVKDCGAVANNFTSVGKGVYLIKNTSGKYLQVPVYSLVNTTSDKAKWMSIEEKVVDPKRQPSFHWIVTKEPATDATKASLKLVNREFPQVQFTGIRLYTDRKGVLTISEEIAPGDSLAKAGGSFIAVTGEYISDKYLGYYHAPESDIKYSKFDLNYYSDVLAWADQPQDFFLGLTGVSGDTTTMIKKGRNTQYSFIPRWTERAYGYRQPINDDGSINTKHDNYIPGLVKNLVRVPYVLQGPDSTYFTVDTEKRYALSKKLTESSATDTVVFFLKANNYAVLTPNSTEKVDFYAMLNLNADGNVAPYANYASAVTASGNNDHHKVGVADDTGWAYDQKYEETRTSAFAVTQYVDPLYRRFDKQNYTYGNGRDSVAEKFQGDSSRWAPLYLKFNDMIQDWMVLYENSSSTNKYRTGLKNISILGLQDDVHFKEGDALYNTPYYQFYVDTAFVTRQHSGALTKESKLYTPMPQYMLAVNPSVLTKSKVWYQTGGATWVDGERKPNDWKEGEYDDAIELPVDNMTVGRYLFNAQDSVNAGNNEYKGKIENNIENDILLSFVKGVHFQDTFYVLEGTDLEKYVVIATAEKPFDAAYAYDQAKKLQAAQALKGVLYQLSWYHKHPLDKNTHYVERFTVEGSSDEETAQMRADSIAEYKKNIGTKVPSWIENGKSMVFQFRLRNVGQTGGNPNRDFYIETQKVGDVAEVGPSEAKFIKNHNGVPVISPIVKFPKDTDDSYAALGFNVSKADEDAYGKPGYTSAEAAYVNDATIISNAGSVSVLNAAGKTVTVTNVLGQTIAKTVAASDNATIALPKGIVVVSVDGKSTKAVVK